MPRLLFLLRTKMTLMALGVASLLVVAGCLGGAATPAVTSAPSLTAPSALPPVTGAPPLTAPAATEPPATAASAAPAASGQPSTAVGAAPTRPSRFGVQLLLDDGAHPWRTDLWSSHLEFARRAVGEWGFAVQLIRTDSLKVNEWQYFMDLCAQVHLTPILRLATTYQIDQHSWAAPPRDPDGSYKTIAAQYATFLSSLKWPTDAHYVIVGNEPNHGNEWSNQPDPAAYARFLIDVADAIHTADPKAKVMNAGFDSFAPHTNGQPAPDGYLYVDEESFMDGMIAAQPDVFSHLDVWASHSYPLGPFTYPPWFQVYQIDLTNGATNPHHVDPPAGIFNRGINTYEWELFKLSTYGITMLPVIITETGWRHIESTNEDSIDVVEGLPRARDLARYLRYAYEGNTTKPYSRDPDSGWKPWLSDPRLIAVCIFALDGFPDAWGHTNLVAVDKKGVISEAYPHFLELEKLSSGQ